MCGIAGCWLTDAGQFRESAKRIKYALAEMAHRGPDSQGIWRSNPDQVLLGHRRLSIIDLSDAGRQPMSWEDDQIVMVFNGEIYNYVELRKDLTQLGYVFRTNSDTEVLLALYHHAGEEFVHQLCGMFALAIWDGREKKMLFARDRVGKKPFYYSETPHGFYFASEINSLRSLLPTLHLSVDQLALDSYLSFGRVVGERTIYERIRELPPAHLGLLRTPQSFQKRRYWRIDWDKQNAVGFREAVEVAEQHLQQAIRIRLRSDVPVGVFLSGGIDSGLVAALASRMSSRPLKTMCIGFGDAAVDERPLARMVAERYATDHEEILLEPDVKSDLPEIARAYGEPFADASAIPSYLVSKVASQHCKVVLNGDGGDELFCGYRRHVAAEQYQALRRLLGGRIGISALSTIVKWLPEPRRKRNGYGLLHRFLRCCTANDTERFLIYSSDLFRPEEKARLLRDPSGEAQSRANLGEYIAQFNRLDELQTMLALDFESFLPDGLLVKMDIASMAHSIEARSPFLDHQLAEWAFAVPPGVRLGMRTTKPILRAIARRYLPPAVTRAPKRGFEIPLARWIEGDLRELCHDEILAQQGLVASVFEKRELSAILEGRSNEMRGPRRPQMIYTLLMLALWDRHCNRTHAAS